jgi:anti-sigma factor RsiW
MRDYTCDDMRLLVQADIDHELTPAEAASVQMHMQQCPRCDTLHRQLHSIVVRLRQEPIYHTAPDELRETIRARLAALALDAKPAPPHWRRVVPRLRLAGSFGTGFALAAGLAFVVLLPRAAPLPEAVVSDHIRALQPGHLTDVVSSDQHTVKPWFDGRLDFAPPVKNFETEGFSLAGGRLDYLAGKQVAALIYYRRQHVIDLYVWPDDGHSDGEPNGGRVSGYNFLHWRQGGMAFWAVSDLDAKELRAFVNLMQKD